MMEASTAQSYFYYRHSRICKGAACRRLKRTDVTAPDDGEGVASGVGVAGGEGEFVSALPREGLLDGMVPLVCGCADSEAEDGDEKADGEPPPEAEVT